MNSIPSPYTQFFGNKKRGTTNSGSPISAMQNKLMPELQQALPLPAWSVR